MGMFGIFGQGCIERNGDILWLMGEALHWYIVKYEMARIVWAKAHEAEAETEGKHDLEEHRHHHQTGKVSKQAL